MIKKRALSAVLTLGVCLSLMGCSSSSSKTDSSTKDTTKTKESNWELVNCYTYEFPVYKTGFYNKDFGITVGYKGEIHYTNDGGETWPQAENHSYCRFGVDIPSENVAYSCGNGGHVTKTTDGGETWLTMRDFGDNEPNQCVMMSFSSEEIGMIASEKKLAVTTDGATSWNELTPPAPIVTINMVNDKTAYLLGTDQKLYVTNDAGQTWNETDFGLTGNDNFKWQTQAFAMNFNEDQTVTIFAFDSDRILRCYTSTDNGKTVTEETIPEITEGLLLYLSIDGKCLTVNTAQGDKSWVLSHK